MERLLVPLATVLTAGSLAAQTSVSVPPQSPRSAIRFSYELSALPALWSQGGLGPVEVDTSVGGPAAGDGGPLTIGGRTFRSGLGTHATSAIAYDLDGSALAFGSWIGVDDAVGANGSVVFEVQVDGVVAYTSGLLTGADGPVHTGRIDVAGAHELLLVVRDGGDGAQDDHANWADATVFATTRPVGDGTRLRATRGDWEPVMPWPLDPIQAVLLDTGDLLTSASQQADGPGDDSPGAPHDGTRADLSDPATFGHTAVDHPTEEVFGAALARLSDGTLLAAGGFGGRVGSGAPIGQDQASRFDSAELAWIPAANGPLARWGASGITLGDGSLLAVGGVDGNTGRDASARFDGASWTELPGASLASWLDVG
ncbi:MAG: NPCBM/NEW2 domain-containing protein, partial [Planctomycetota bacterium]